MTKPSNISGIEEATRRSWDEWVTSLDERGARNMEHRDIADIVFKILDGDVESPGWWSQAVTVAYEQHIGKRAPGQKTDGSYEFSVTKIIPGTKQDVFALWNEAHGQASEFAGEPLTNIRTSVTEVRLYWRADFENGSRLAVAVEQKAAEKAMIAVTHTKLASESDKDAWHQFWRRTLDKL